MIARRAGRGDPGHEQWLISMEKNLESLTAAHLRMAEHQ
jgi:hypothetical protein